MTLPPNLDPRAFAPADPASPLNGYACARRSARTPNALASASKPAKPTRGIVLAVFGSFERPDFEPDVPTAPCVLLAVEALGIEVLGVDALDVVVLGVVVLGAGAA
jgi:hypothetical protein